MKTVCFSRDKQRKVEEIEFALDCDSVKMQTPRVLSQLLCVRLLLVLLEIVTD